MMARIEKNSRNYLRGYGKERIFWKNEGKE